MAGKQIGSFWVKLGITDKELVKGLKNAENQLNKFSFATMNLGKTMTYGISIPLAAAIAGIAKLGIDAVETQNLFEVSMGKMAGSAEKFAKDMSKSFGLNEYEVKKNISTFNIMLGSMKLGEQAAYKMSKSLTKLTYDVGSLYNIDTKTAFQKLQSGIMGEVRPNSSNCWKLLRALMLQRRDEINPSANA